VDKVWLNNLDTISYDRIRFKCIRSGSLNSLLILTKPPASSEWTNISTVKFYVIDIMSLRISF